MMGLAKTSVMVAFWTAAANFRLYDAYERDQARRARATKDGVQIISRRTPRRHRAVSLSVRPPGGTDPPTKLTPATV